MIVQTLAIYTLFPDFKMNLKHEKIPKIILDDSQVYDVELYKIKEVKVQKKRFLFFCQLCEILLLKGL